MGERRLLAANKAGKRLTQFTGALRRPWRHLGLMSTLRDARRAGLAPAAGLIEWKYLGDYLGRQFDADARCSIIGRHYRFLLDRLDGSAAAHWALRSTLWESASEVSGAVRRIIHRPATLAPMEGECELVFTADDEVLATLTFTVLAGGIGTMPCRTALSIGGLQGALAARSAIRAAARENGEIAPAAMLLIAARSLAEALDVEMLAGISNSDHIARIYAGDAMRFDYDQLWTDLGGEPGLFGWFWIDPREHPQRSLSHLSSAHRARARRRAAHRRGLQEQIRNRLEVLLAPPIRAAAE